jgi:hypothetical protein
MAAIPTTVRSECVVAYRDIWPTTLGDLQVVCFAGTVSPVYIWRMPLEVPVNQNIWVLDAIETIRSLSGPLSGLIMS